MKHKMNSRSPCGLMSFNSFACLSQLLLNHKMLIFFLVLNEIDIAINLKMGYCISPSLVGKKWIDDSLDKDGFIGMFSMTPYNLPRACFKLLGHF